MITITIKTASVISDIRIKSQMNTERIKDPEERYAVRAGEENGSEVMEGLQEAFRSLKSLCRRFLQATDDTAGNDAFDSSTTDKTLTFDVTERRTSNIADSLAQDIHNYLVGGTLRRFYTSAMMPDLVTLYGATENNARDEIVNLLYRKLEPVWEEDEPEQSEEQQEP